MWQYMYIPIAFSNILYELRWLSQNNLQLPYSCKASIQLMICKFTSQVACILCTYMAMACVTVVVN